MSNEYLITTMLLARGWCKQNTVAAEHRRGREKFARTKRTLPKRWEQLC